MKITIGMPVYSGIHPEVVRNLITFDLDSQFQRNELVLHFPQSSTLSMSRNSIMKGAIKDNADWVLMWDSDIQVKEKDFLKKMLETAYKTESPVIGAPCRLKYPDQIVFNFADKKDNEYVNYKELPLEPKEIDVIGTGLMLINMNWIKQNFPKAPWFVIVDTETGSFPEDWSFCERVKERGGKIIVDPRIKTVHWGGMGYAI